MSQPIFLPFYERIIIRNEHTFIDKIVFSILLGFIYLVIHCISIGQEVFKDWNWFLSVLITAAMLSLYMASHTLRLLLIDIHERIERETAETLTSTTRRLLSDHRFIMAGIIFGGLNCTIGWVFDIPDCYATLFQKITIYSGYFIAGFVCGMAVLGIYGVAVLIGDFARKAKHAFDFTFPDGCGGTLFLGEAIATFSLVTFTVGVMITIFILKTKWGGDETYIEVLLKYVWIGLPYIMALVALFAPAIPINVQLKKYKRKEDLYFQDKLDNIRKKQEAPELNFEDLKLLREEYSYQLDDRAQLHKMRTWPYGLGVNSQYLIAAVPVFYTSFDVTKKFIYP